MSAYLLGHTESFRVWPDGTVQPVSDGQPYEWMSDDYKVVEAHSEEEAWEMIYG